MISGPRTCSHAACTARWPPQPNAARSIFPELLLTPGVGARTCIAGDGRRGRDGAPIASTIRAFSLAHGGKDRHPYPVPIKVYDETIRVLKGAIQKPSSDAKRDAGDRRLDDQARRLERTASGPSVEAYIAGEREASPDLDGRSVFGWERDVVASRKSTG